MIEKQVEFSLLENGEGNITSLSHQSPQAHNNNPESSHMRRRLPHYHYHKIQGPHKLCQVGSPESEEGDGEGQPAKAKSCCNTLIKASVPTRHV